MKREIKVGDLVRVPGRLSHKRCYGHNLPQGAVLEVAAIKYVFGGSLGSVGIMHPVHGYEQLIGLEQVKLAKQAMKKREQYSERRG